METPLVIRREQQEQHKEINNLIPIDRTEFFDRLGENIDARDLHSFMQVKKKFSDWIKYRIEQHGFEELVDYIVLPNFGKNPQGGRPVDMYRITDSL